MTARPERDPRPAAVILTFNEEQNLDACLSSLRGVVSSVLVVDSGSQDRTLEIARAHAARVVSHPFGSHATQWRWALDQLPADADWVLALDADQRLSTRLREVLRTTFADGAAQAPECVGFYLNRRQIFRGQWIRHGGYYPKYLLKLFRRSHVHIDDRDLMDHHFYVRGRAPRLPGDLIEDNLKERDITFWIRKHADYARRHAQEELLRTDTPSADRWLIPPRLFGSPDQRVVWLKERWFRLPLYVRPFLYFGFRYVVQRGFLDGKQGFVFHFLQAFWYRLLVDVHLDALRAERAVVATA